MALHGAAFMKKFGRYKEGNWYFSLTADGKPLVQPYNIFNDCFGTMAFASLNKATPNESYKQIALVAFENILRRRNNWKGSYKAYPLQEYFKSFHYR